MEEQKWNYAEMQKPTLNVSAEDFNQASARVRIHIGMRYPTVISAGIKIKIEAYEVGWDGRKPPTPLAIAGVIAERPTHDDVFCSDLSVTLGTPFYWTQTTPYRYAARVTIEGNDQGSSFEFTFSLMSDGSVIQGEILQVEPVASATRADLPALFVVSDSTAYSNGPNQLGWGDALGSYFDSKKIRILNRARPGRSSRSFRREGLWDRVLAEMKSGDMVLIQFGHNDVDTLDQGRCRGVLPGTGEETLEVELPNSSREIVHTFGWYLRQMLADAKTRGAQPILLSPTAKNDWLGERLNRNQNPCAAWAAAVSESLGVPFIDATARIADRYDQLGKEKVQALFCNTTDTVHTSPSGAELNAACIAEWLRSCLGPNMLLKER